MPIKRENKIRLSRSEEFEVLKMVFDKLLWIGTIASLYGLYVLTTGQQTTSTGFISLGVGAFFLFLFTSIVVGTIHLPERKH